MPAPWRCSPHNDRTNHSSNSAARFHRALTPLERALIVLAVAVLLGVTLGLLLPRFAAPIAEVTGAYTAQGPAAEALAALSVNDKPHARGYTRDIFGYRQTDDDANGCDVRNDVLARDLQQVQFTRPGSCLVASGVLDDPYTGQRIAFRRGILSSAQVQIDHVVALENAWQSGAWQWDRAKRLRYGNDPYNLLAVQGQANQDKGSASAAYWLPTQRSFQCAYVARQIGVKAKYGLSVTSREKQAMLRVLHDCPAERVPER